jgi:tetratricopeptide (TPR) repeat protein
LTIEPAVHGLAFLSLGERLRQRGQLEAALSVAEAGISRHPGLADGHDLLGRIHADTGELSQAQLAWTAALECEPTHIGALKGLAFLAFRRRDHAEAERHLEAAAMAAPKDVAILAALDRVRTTRPPVIEEIIDFDHPGADLMLFDNQGLRLVGEIHSGTPGLADAIAAEAGGLSREAGRATRLLGLGTWRHLLLEAAGERTVVVPVTESTFLLVRRPVVTPLGRLLAYATRGAQRARQWLEHHG